MKKIYCKSPILLFICFFPVAIIAGCIYGFIGFFMGEFDDNPFLKWGGFVGALVMMLLMILVLVSFVRKRILFTPNQISVLNDFEWRGFFRRLQYAVAVDFTEIIGLSYVETTQNSLGKEMFWVFIPMPYIVFECEDGKEKAINLYHFSKKQRIKIINEVIQRVNEIGRQLNVSSAEELLQNYKDSNK